jgi:putative ABC transport system substrate-binding protein
MLVAGDYSEALILDAHAAGAALGWQIEVIKASTSSEIDAAFATLVEKQCAALAVYPGLLFTIRRVQIVTLAERYAMPTIYIDRPFVEVIACL